MVSIDKKINTAKIQITYYIVILGKNLQQQQTILQQLTTTTQSFFIRRRKKALVLLIQIAVKIVWDSVDLINGSWDAYLTSPVDFAGVNDIIANLAKGERAYQRSESVFNVTKIHSFR